LLQAVYISAFNSINQVILFLREQIKKNRKQDTAVYRKLFLADKHHFESYTPEAGLVYTFGTLSNTDVCKTERSFV